MARYNATYLSFELTKLPHYSKICFIVTFLDFDNRSKVSHKFACLFFNFRNRFVPPDFKMLLDIKIIYAYYDICIIIKYE